MMYTVIVDTPLGEMLAAAGDGALCGLWFTGQKYFPRNADTWTNAPAYPVFAPLKKWLKDYFSGEKPELLFSLAPRGTEFQKAVWDLLLKIPPGKTSTYGALAARLISSGRKASAQAVGGAVGHNPVSLIIPCHRVLGSDGSLTGYAGGIEKKQALLRMERDWI